MCVCVLISFTLHMFPLTQYYVHCTFRNLCHNTYQMWDFTTHKCIDTYISIHTHTHIYALTNVYTHDLLTHTSLSLSLSFSLSLSTETLCSKHIALLNDSSNLSASISYNNSISHTHLEWKLFPYSPRRRTRASTGTAGMSYLTVGSR